jgi:glutamyl-tRNA synthetase
VSQYRALGVPAERIVGLVAEWCGLGPRRELPAADFAREFRWERLPRAPIVFTPADDAWLRAAAETNDRLPSRHGR